VSIAPVPLSARVEQSVLLRREIDEWLEDDIAGSARVTGTLVATQASSQRMVLPS
jgi:hypothetical protein